MMQRSQTSMEAKALFLMNGVSTDFQGILSPILQKPRTYIEEKFIKQAQGEVNLSGIIFASPVHHWIL